GRRIRDWAHCSTRADAYFSWIDSRYFRRLATASASTSRPPDFLNTGPHIGISRVPWASVGGSLSARIISSTVLRGKVPCRLVIVVRFAGGLVKARGAGPSP